MKKTTVSSAVRGVESLLKIKNGEGFLRKLLIGRFGIIRERLTSIVNVGWSVMCVVLSGIWK